MLKLATFALLVFGLATLYILLMRHYSKSGSVKTTHDPAEAVRKSLEEVKRELDGD